MLVFEYNITTDRARYMSATNLLFRPPPCDTSKWTIYGLRVYIEIIAV